MRNYLLLSAFALSLLGCTTDEDDDIVPAPIGATFDQDFSLNYHQQAVLPAAGQPELIVTVTDLQYAICPKEAYCIVADFVAPTLSITDAQDRTQQVKLPVGRTRANSTAWLDTVSVRANGQRYLLYYQRWDIKAASQQPAAKDITVAFRITKPADN